MNSQESIKAHCQICEREIKAKFGVIAHHGYKRQNGWQSNSCIGARESPYEKSRDVIPKAIAVIDSFIANKENTIKEAKEGHISVPAFRYEEPIKPEDAKYPTFRDSYVRELESQIDMAKRDKARLKIRFDSWKLGANKWENQECAYCKNKDWQGLGVRLHPRKEIFCSNKCAVKWANERHNNWLKVEKKIEELEAKQ